MDSSNTPFFSQVFRSPVPNPVLAGSQTPAQPSSSVPGDGNMTPSLPFFFSGSIPGSATVHGTPTPLFTPVSDDDMDADIDRFCDTRPSSPDVETQSQSLSPDAEAMSESVANAPLMSCLDPPTNTSSGVIPRSSSVKSDLCEGEFENPRRPHKIPRMGDVRSINLGRISRCRSEFTRSASGLPLPDMSLLCLEQPHDNTVVLEGLRFPVVPGIETSHTHYYITAETAAGFLDGKTYPMPPKCKLIVLDARSNPEYAVGHVRGAINITIPGIRSQINDLVVNARRNDEIYFVLCYCEFSSARAPNLRDVILATEQDVMYKERKTAELRTSEKSRFHVLIIQKGYNRFFEVNPELCEPMGYIKEEQLPEDVDKQYRTLYQAEIDCARASYVLAPSHASLVSRSKSSMDLLRRPHRSENRDFNLSVIVSRNSGYISDEDETDGLISPRPIKRLVFDDK